jgi:hypothetical protein
MFRKMLVAVASVTLLMGAGSALDAKAPCRDTHGKFMKCPEAKPKVQRCRDAKGRFAKCGSPGAKPPM